MHRLIPLALLLNTPLLLGGDPQDEVAKELKALEGTWKTVAMEVQGTSIAPADVIDFVFIIGPGGKSTGKSPQGEYQSMLIVDPRPTPPTLDNQHETGLHKGKTQYGIYKLERDTLTVCITAPGATPNDRPKDFTTRDTANVLFVFQRVKPQAP